MQFPLFEHIREQILLRTRRRRKQQDLSENQSIAERALITALSAGVAGGLAAAITTPIDVVKTRIMLAAAGEAGSTATPSSAARKTQKTNKSSLFVGREVYRTEGIRGLFKGGILRCGWTAVGLGLYLGAYETGRMYFEKRRKDKDRRTMEYGNSVT